MEDTTKKTWIRIPTELIGSLPRSSELIEAQRSHRDGELTAERLAHLQEKDIERVLAELEETGSPQLTDGELMKPSFLSYPIYDLTPYSFTFDDENLPTMTFSDGHQRLLPQLIAAPFRYAKFAVEYLRLARKYTKFPLKQAVIAPSALSLVYTRETIENYSREQFLVDLIDQSEKDIRQCLDEGVDAVQLDFSDARFSWKLDSTGELFQQSIEINNRLLQRFNDEEKKRLGVHICSGNDNGCTHSSDVPYSKVLSGVFRLDVNNFYLQLAAESEPESVLLLIARLIRPHQRVFLGVINPMDFHVESPEEVRDRVLLAAKYLPLDQLGTTDDCGYAPYDDCEYLTREVAYQKIRARIQGTKMAEDILN